MTKSGAVLKNSLSNNSKQFLLLTQIDEVRLVQINLISFNNKLIFKIVKFHAHSIKFDRNITNNVNII